MFPQESGRKGRPADKAWRPEKNNGRAEPGQPPEEVLTRSEDLPQISGQESGRGVGSARLRASEILKSALVLFHKRNVDQ